MNMQTNITDNSARHAILDLMRDGRWRTTGDFETKLGETASNIRRAVQELREAGHLILEINKTCKAHMYQISDTAPPPMRPAPPVCTEESWLKHMPGAGQRAPLGLYETRPAANFAPQPESEKARREKLIKAQLSKPLPMSEIMARIAELSRDQITTALNDMLHREEVRKVGGGRFLKWEGAA